MTQMAEEKQTQVDFFQATQSQGGNLPDWAQALRRSGREEFEKVGFPSTKVEAWRFTNVAPIARTAFRSGSGDVTAEVRELVDRQSFGNEAAAELVFVNGQYQPELSRLGTLPGKIHLGLLSEAIASKGDIVRKHLGTLSQVELTPFIALNTGVLHEGVFIHLQRGATLEAPIHVLWVSTGGSEATVSHPRLLLVGEDNVEASVVESFAGIEDSVYWTNAVSEFYLSDDCRIDHNKLNQESKSAFHTAAMQVRVGRNTNFVSHSSTLGGKLTRNDLGVKVDGEFAYATLNGLVFLDGDRHCDNHTLLDHASPNCPSHELYKHVLGDRASGVFKGKILVRNPAQKTDSKQTSKSLLLSDSAVMNSMPALEIYADDVKCTHGSTIGPVDEDMIFYLRSRGVSLDAAKHLLTYAFAADITRRIRVGPVRAHIEDAMAAQHGLPQDLRINDLGAFDDDVAN